MPIKVTCNSCGGVLHAPDDAAGKRGRCPTCGMILSIPTDAPRVAAEPLPAPVPTAASATYGVAPGNELAFPKPPSFGDDAAKASFGQRSSTGAAMASRLPPDPRRVSDPFAKTAKPPQHAEADKLARKWTRVYRGLGFVQWGIVICALGIVLPAVLTALEQNGVAFPDKDPGWLDTRGLSRMSEIKAALAVVFFLIAGLFFVFGRFGVTRVPRESGGHALSCWSALATLFAFFGMLAVLVFAFGASINHAPPQIIPHADVFDPAIRAQVRAERYVQHLFLSSDEITGQIQRYGMLAFCAGGLIAELWFLGSLSRLAVHLQNARAVGRLNRSAIAFGILFLLLTFAWLAFDLQGREWFYGQALPKWNNLDAGTKTTARSGIVIGIGFLVAMVYSRSIGGIRRAIREANLAG